MESVFEDPISTNEVSIERWTPYYNSADSSLAYLANLTLTGIPCNLCTPSIVEYIVGAFALLQKHFTVADVSTDNQNSVAGDSIYRYHCSAWYRHLSIIPETILIKMLPAHLANHLELSKVANAICSVLEIRVTVVCIADKTDL
jgi:hypothetical protein